MRAMFAPPQKKIPRFFFLRALSGIEDGCIFSAFPWTSYKNTGAPRTPLSCALRCTEKAPGSAGEALRRSGGISSFSVVTLFFTLSLWLFCYQLSQRNFSSMTLKSEEKLKQDTQRPHQQRCGPLWLRLQEDDETCIRTLMKKIA